MGFNSPSLNPENEQVQYLQKIALRAENPAAPSVFYYILGLMFIFCTKCNFLLPLRQHIFLQKQPGHWAEVVCHFQLLLINLKFVIMSFRERWRTSSCRIMSLYERRRTSYHRIMSLYERWRTCYHRIMSLYERRRTSYYRIMSLYERRRICCHRIMSFYERWRTCYHRIMSLYERRRTSYHRIMSLYER